MFVQDEIRLSETLQFTAGIKLERNDYTGWDARRRLWRSRAHWCERTARKTLAKFREASLDEKDQGKVRYLTTDFIVEYLDGLGRPQTTEQVVRGYKVRTVH